MGRHQSPEQHLVALIGRARALLFAFALLAPAAPAPAQESAPAAVESTWPSTVGWLIAGSAVAGSFLLDDEVREELYLERPEGVGGLERVGNRFGNPLVASSLIALGYAAGRATDRPGLAESSARAAAGFLATGAITQTLKWAVGRPRPDLGPDDQELRPMSFDNDYQSWPSGHAATAFSLATSLAMESDRTSVGVVAYGLAGVTAWSRIYDDRHWTSDVVAGAVIGTVATRATIRWIEARQAGDAPPALAIIPGGLVLTLSVP
jgi:membrane-associated phospholipid phosphatase